MAVASRQSSKVTPAMKRVQQQAQLKIARQAQQNTQRTKKLTEKAATAISRALFATGGGIFIAVLIPVIMVLMIRIASCVLFLIF